MIFPPSSSLSELLGVCEKNLGEKMFSGETRNKHKTRSCRKMEAVKEKIQVWRSGNRLYGKHQVFRLITTDELVRVIRGHRGHEVDPEERRQELQKISS